MKTDERASGADPDDELDQVAADVRLIATSFVTIDGVMEAPGFDEHRDGRNAWALRIQDDETEQFNREMLFGADAILLGRTTYQIWAAFWPTAGGELAQRMNEVPKYVVSNTLQRADWQNTTIIRGDVVAEIHRLKERPGGEILLYGSADLLNSLLPEGLIDEYRLFVYPVILGSGKHLFRDRIDTQYLRLVSARAFRSGVALLTYGPGAETPTSRYVEAYSWTQEQVLSMHAARDTARVLATVLFTDIVQSTEHAARVGDRAWRQLLDNHDDIARAEVDRWHGQLVKSTGDGILATFDAPTRALRCAFALHDGVADLGVRMRAAVHTGEVEMREADVGGIGVHIAARALEEAAAGQVVVTRTVRDLATGTDLSFTALGTVGLRGVPGQWELFDAATSQAERAGNAD